MRLTNIKIPLSFAAAKLLIHLLTNTPYGFHRDELLYLALGRHLDWGYWSNPPVIGFIGFLSQQLLGDSIFAARLAPALFSAATVFFTCLMARDLGGRNFAQIAAGIAAFSSLAYLRTGHLFQPVAVDIFCWTISSWLVIRYLKTGGSKWLLWLGVALGVGFLNKYSVAFLMAALALAFLATPERRIFLKKHTWYGVGLFLLLILPNLIWQWLHDFPVLHHMADLSATQLDRVDPVNFLVDQLLMHFWGFLIWLPGLYVLLFHPTMKKYRAIGWFYVATLLLFLAMSGKGYYTLGAYPAIMAAGGVFWEQKLRKLWQRWTFAMGVLLINLPLLPTGIPILPIPQAVAYFDFLSNRLGIEGATRWEQGNVEALPQDFADMLGWEELGQLVDQAAAKAGDPSRIFIFCENYGQAAAVERYSTYPDLPPVASFSDSYLLWSPDTLPDNVDVMIYVNDELGEDVAALFSSVEIVGAVQHPYARERGTQVYLCQGPTSDFQEFWRGRAAEEKGVIAR